MVLILVTDVLCVVCCVVCLIYYMRVLFLMSGGIISCVFYVVCGVLVILYHGIYHSLHLVALRELGLTLVGVPAPPVQFLTSNI